MPSTGKPTPFCGLNQWQGPDKPARMDFNQDNEKTDAALSSLSAQLSKKANQTYVEDRLNQTMDKAGSFNGNGDLGTATQVNHWYEIKLASGVSGLPPGVAASYNNSALYVFGQNSNSFTQVLFCGNGYGVYMRKYID